MNHFYHYEKLSVPITIQIQFGFKQVDLCMNSVWGVDQCLSNLGPKLNLTCAFL